jgi:hypothetical protein
MYWRQTLGAALVMTAMNSCNCAWATSLDDSTEARRALAISTVDGGFGKMLESLTPFDGLFKKKKQDAPRVEKYLLDGKLAAGETDLIARLKEHPKDDQARFGLGVLQFLQAVERLGQDLYHYGLRNYSEYAIGMAVLGLPVPANPAPNTINYQQARKIVETFAGKLLQAEATLALVTSGDVKLPLHFGMIRLDLNGDGRTDESESLWKIYAHTNNNRKDISEETAQAFFIKFDRGDVHWLRGYCNLLMAVCNIYLAYDSEDAFNHTAHLLFTRPDPPYQFPGKGKYFRHSIEELNDILDLVALIHLIRCDVIEPQKMEAALHNLEAVITQSRETWKWIMAETDDDHEWLPNPRQTGVIPNVRVTEAMVTAWGEIMNESEKILSGKLLIPFWRGEEGLGINIRKVFLQPRAFDLLLWVQGSSAIPYLEKGEMTKGDTWQKLRGEFGPQFPGFALWFN